MQSGGRNEPLVTRSSLRCLSLKGSAEVPSETNLPRHTLYSVPVHLLIPPARATALKRAGKLRQSENHPTL